MKNFLENPSKPFFPNSWPTSTGSAADTFVDSTDSNSRASLLYCELASFFSVIVSPLIHSLFPFTKELPFGRKLLPSILSLVKYTDMIVEFLKCNKEKTAPLPPTASPKFSSSPFPSSTVFSSIISSSAPINPAQNMATSALAKKSPPSPLRTLPPHSLPQCASPSNLGPYFMDVGSSSSSLQAFYLGLSQGPPPSSHNTPNPHSQPRVSIAPAPTGIPLLGSFATPQLTPTFIQSPQQMAFDPLSPLFTSSSSIFSSYGSSTIQFQNPTSQYYIPSPTDFHLPPLVVHVPLSHFFSTESFYSREINLLESDIVEVVPTLFFVSNSNDEFDFFRQVHRARHLRFTDLLLLIYLLPSLEMKFLSLPPGQERLSFILPNVPMRKRMIFRYQEPLLSVSHLTKNAHHLKRGFVSSCISLFSYFMNCLLVV
jgi:hypothetical protein